MSLVIRIVFGLLAALIVGIIAYFVVATIIVYATFFMTPTMWAEWNMLTLPFQYSVEWGYCNPLVHLITIIIMVISFIIGAITLD